MLWRLEKMGRGDSLRKTGTGSQPGLSAGEKQPKVGGIPEACRPLSNLASRVRRTAPRTHSFCMIAKVACLLSLMGLAACGFFADQKREAPAAKPSNTVALNYTSLNPPQWLNL